VPRGLPGASVKAFETLPSHASSRTGKKRSMYLDSKMSVHTTCEAFLAGDDRDLIALAECRAHPPTCFYTATNRRHCCLSKITRYGPATGILQAKCGKVRSRQTSPTILQTSTPALCRTAAFTLSRTSCSTCCATLCEFASFLKRIQFAN
jgi:hypothetical protein